MCAFALCCLGVHGVNDLSWRCSELSRSASAVSHSGSSGRLLAERLCLLLDPYIVGCISAALSRGPEVCPLAPEPLPASMDPGLLFDLDGAVAEQMRRGSLRLAQGAEEDEEPRGQPRRPHLSRATALVVVKPRSHQVRGRPLLLPLQ